MGEYENIGGVWFSVFFTDYGAGEAEIHANICMSVHYEDLHLYSIANAVGFAIIVSL